MRVMRAANALSALDAFAIFGNPFSASHSLVNAESVCRKSAHQHGLCPAGGKIIMANREGRDVPALTSGGKLREGGKRGNDRGSKIFVHVREPFGFRWGQPTGSI